MLTPVGSTTQLRFGGADLCDYYINVVLISPVPCFFCASDMSAFMTGSTLLVDAGQTA